MKREKKENILKRKKNENDGEKKKKCSVLSMAWHCLLLSYSPSSLIAIPSVVDCTKLISLTVSVMTQSDSYCQWVCACVRVYKNVSLSGRQINETYKGALH